MLDQFSDWLNARKPEIDTVGLLLCSQLSSEPSELIEDLAAIEAWNGRTNELLASCNAFLDRAKLFYLPQSGEMRENERKAIVEDKVADIRKVRDILEGYLDSIKQRLILGESILRWEKPTHTPEYRDPSIDLQRSAANIMRENERS